MSYLRFTIDLAIKEPIPTALKDKLLAIRTAIKELRGYASVINAGTPNEERTTRAVYHRCLHDEGKPCEAEIEI